MYAACRPTPTVFMLFLSSCSSYYYFNNIPTVPGWHDRHTACYRAAFFDFPSFEVEFQGHLVRFLHGSLRHFMSTIRATCSQSLGEQWYFPVSKFDDLYFSFSDHQGGFQIFVGYTVFVLDLNKGKSNLPFFLILFPYGILIFNPTSQSFFAVR